MQIPLTAEQMALIKQATGPIYMTNAQTGEYYLLQEVRDDDNLSDWYPAMFESAWRAGWGDPAMNVYDNYDEELKKLQQRQAESRGG